MNEPRPMDTRELGLVLGRQLLGVEDLHYGLWEPDLELSLANLSRAQQRYSERLLGHLPPAETAGRVIDIGCGTGRLLKQILDRGYAADGVVPAPELARQVRERLAAFPGNDSRLYECRFEDFPVKEHEGRYGVALFSESFQYISPRQSLPLLEQILVPGGLLVICDFFRTEHHGDGLPGDRSFGGGHDLAEFYAEIATRPFRNVCDEDITHLVSPNLKILNDLLLNKVQPVLRTLADYLEGNHPRLFRLARWLARRRLEKIAYKYFSGHRSQAVFERYKSYHLMVYRYEPANAAS